MSGYRLFKNVEICHDFNISQMSNKLSGILSKMGEVDDILSGNAVESSQFWVWKTETRPSSSSFELCWELWKVNKTLKNVKKNVKWKSSIFSANFWLEIGEIERMELQIVDIFVKFLTWNRWNRADETTNLR
jgi:hypothetical protein